MEVIVARADLASALARATAVIERKNTIPVLANVLIEAADDGLRLTATDLEAEISLRIDAQVTEPGATTVDAQLLHSIAREMPEGSQIELKQDNERIRVSGGRSRYRLNRISAEDFPRLPFAEDAPAFALQAKDMSAMLAKVVHAQLNDVARPYLNGMAIEASDGLLTLVATDGNRLAVAEHELPEGAEAIPRDTILPRKLVGIVQRLLTDADGEVIIAIGQGKARFTLNGVQLTGKLIDGSYPEWRRVVPSANGKRLSVGVAGFSAGIRRAALIAQEKTRAVRIVLTADKAAIDTVSPDLGTAEEEVPAAWNADELQVGFNSRLLLEMLAASGAEQIEADFHDGAAPVLFTNPSDTMARWVVMPMRV